MLATAKRPISADSHITEPPDAYDSIDAAFRDTKPYMHHDDEKGSFYVIPPSWPLVVLGLIALAGIGAVTKYSCRSPPAWRPASRPGECRRRRGPSKYGFDCRVPSGAN